MAESMETSMIGQKVRYKGIYLQAPMTEGSEYHQLMTVTATRKCRRPFQGYDSWTEIQTDVTGNHWLQMDCLYVTEE